MGSARDELLQLVELRAACASGEARRLREKNGLSLTDIAKASGAHFTSISKWEQGQRKPRGEVALAYWAVLKDLRSAAEGGEPDDE